jgi:hypothetical protein
MSSVREASGLSALLQVQGAPADVAPRGAANALPAHRYKDTWDGLRTIVRTQGWRQLYAGLSINYLKVPFFHDNSFSLRSDPSFRVRFILPSVLFRFSTNFQRFRFPFHSTPASATTLPVKGFEDL